MPRLHVLLAGLLVLSLAALVGAEHLPVYRPVPGLAGQITVVGSKSGSEVIVRWAEAFRRLHPGVAVDVDLSGGSTSAFPSLVSGRATLAPMSRPMTPGMIDEYVQRRGRPPLEVRIGIGGASVVVNAANPIAGLTRSQLDGIFSQTYMLSPRAILRWGLLGLEGEWRDRPIALYGLEQARGAWGLFRAEAMTMSGQMKPQINARPSSTEVVEAVAADPAGIGFIGLEVPGPGVKVVPVASDGVHGAATLGYERAVPDDPHRFVTPVLENLIGETYPLTRIFRIYLDREPGRPLAPVVAEFLRYGLSAEGQAAMREAGYQALPPELAAVEMRRLQ